MNTSRVLPRLSLPVEGMYSRTPRLPSGTRAFEVRPACRAGHEHSKYVPRLEAPTRERGMSARSELPLRGAVIPRLPGFCIKLLPLPGVRGMQLPSPHPAFGHLLPREKDTRWLFVGKPIFMQKTLRFGLVMPGHPSLALRACIA